MEIFRGSFTQQLPIPETGIAAALKVMRHGRLHRYNLADGEAGETALLEQEFAAFTGAKYCLAVASGGYAMGCALRALSVRPGDPVLTNAFTLAPVPGAIAALSARPVFVEVTPDLVIDIDDLDRKIIASSARVLLLSHMRGHICDMDRLSALCAARDVQIVEDCAHTMGGSWAGVTSGRHGVAGCYSTQTFKHLNSGEGGLIVTDDSALMARMVMLSGSYMLFDRHLSAPDGSAFATSRFETPNVSGRMDNLRAAILRPQLAELPLTCTAWNQRYARVEAGLRNQPGLRPIHRADSEGFVGSSIQFFAVDLGPEQVETYIAACQTRGVELKWFGRDEPKGYTSRHDSWRYAETQSLPQTDRILSGLIDMRIPMTFSLDDCDLIARIIAEERRRIT